MLKVQYEVVLVISFTRCERIASLSRSSSTSIIGSALLFCRIASLPLFLIEKNVLSEILSSYDKTDAGTVGGGNMNRSDGLKFRAGVVEGETLIAVQQDDVARTEGEPNKELNFCMKLRL